MKNGTPRFFTLFETCLIIVVLLLGEVGLVAVFLPTRDSVGRLQGSLHSNEQATLRLTKALTGVESKLESANSRLEKISAEANEVERLSLQWRELFDRRLDELAEKIRSNPNTK